MQDPVAIRRLTFALQRQIIKMCFVLKVWLTLKISFSIQKIIGYVHISLDAGGGACVV
jgi:hypothetical protein